MDYKQKYFKYKQKYLNLLKDQKGGEPFLIDFSAKQVYLWLFAKNQRQLDFIFTGRQISFTMPPLENITLNHKYRLSLLTKGSLSVVLASKLVPNKYLARRILSRLHVFLPISPPTCIANIPGHTNSVGSIAFHPTQSIIVSASVDGMVKLWDCRNPRYPTHIRDLFKFKQNVSSIVFHPNPNLHLLAISSVDKTVKLWDCIDPRNPAFKADLTGHTDYVTSVAFHPTLPYLVSSSFDSTIKLWDCLNPQNPFIRDLQHAHNDWKQQVSRGQSHYINKLKELNI